jgi:exonuclease SbcC
MNILKVLSITVKGFKNQMEEVTFELGDFTKITADNAQGKTTLGEAITWILHGSNLMGNDKSDSALLNQFSEEMYGAIKFETETGLHELTRVKKSSVSLKLDGIKITQTQLEESLISRKLFLSVFNPNYFPSLSSSDGRALLIKVLPKINSEEIINSLDGQLSKVLVKENLSDTNSTLKKLRITLTDLEKKINFIQGGLESKKTMLEGLIIPEAVSFDETVLNSLQAELEDMGKDKPQLLDNSSYIQEKAKLDKELALLGKGETVELEDIRELELKYASYMGQVKALDNQLEEILDMGNVCYTCNQPITEDHKDELCCSTVDKLQETKEIAEKVKKQIEDTVSRNKAKEVQYNKEIETRRTDLRQKLSALASQDIEKENRKIIDEHEVKVSAKRMEVKSKINEIKSRKDASDKANYERQYALKMKEDLQKKISQDEENFKSLNNIKVSTNIKVLAIQAYNTKYVEVLTKSIQQHLDKVSIVIQEVSKEGELKECFELYYEGKEYKLLSNSEKIRTGLEIGKLVMDSLNISLPTFIDNAESITEYPTPKGQVIEASVVKGVKGLQIIKL